MNRRLTRLVIVLAGIVFGQAVLYGPSLAGRKILLPLDILTYPGFYLPRTPEISKVEIQNIYLQDLVCVFEPARRFAASELKAGRFPWWLPYQFGGSPFIEPKFSPFLAPQLFIASPVILAWTQLLAALVAGLGAYLFSRRALGVGFWPASVVAWCYPLTAFFVLWQGYPTAGSVYWLPWLFLTIHGTVARHSRLYPPALAVVTALVLVSGHLDVAAQVLLGGGLFALAAWHRYYSGQWVEKQAMKTMLTLAAAWTLGFLLAAPQVFPMLEYARTGERFEHRRGGEEERPPTGLSALPQIVLPEMYGAYGPEKTGSYRVVPDNQIESSAAAYAGVVATLFLAPLAFCDRRRLPLKLFFAGLALLALSWCLNIPGVVGLLRLPGLNLMSHSRLVFLAGFAILTLAGLGMETLRSSEVQWRKWMWAPAGLLAGLVVWCGYRSIWLPEPIATRLTQAVSQGQAMGWVHTPEAVRRVQDWFVIHSLAAALLCGSALAGWMTLRLRPGWQPRLLPAVATILLADLIWFAYGRSPQSDPALYFPEVPVLRQIANAAPGRVAGYFCLPATLPGACGLSDLRGYDGVDPARMVELLQLAAGPPTSNPKYALTQYLVPRITPTPEGSLRLPPLLDMLGVRYVVFRGPPAPGAKPVFQGPDYWVLVNSNALERAFIPHHVECIPDKAARLKVLGDEKFAPREVAYVESLLELPNAIRGSATLMKDIPCRVTVSTQMETRGLLVLSDRWDNGWKAFLDGHRVPIIQVNHAVRGVVVPAGTSTVQFRYEPSSLLWGLRSALAAMVALLGWMLVLLKNGVRTSPRQAQANAEV